MPEEKFVQPPTISKTRVIRFDRLKNVWVVNVNVKEQYTFDTEDKAIEFLKTASVPPKICVIGCFRDKKAKNFGNVYEIVQVFKHFVLAHSCHDDSFSILPRKSMWLYPFSIGRKIMATNVSEKLRNFKFNIGDIVRGTASKFKGKVGVVEDRWIDFVDYKPIYLYRVKTDDGNIYTVDETFLKKTQVKTAATKYIDPLTNEIKELTDLGMSESPELPDEVNVGGRIYKKVVIAD
jgi:hypothetical protein